MSSDLLLWSRMGKLQEIAKFLALILFISALSFGIACFPSVSSLTGHILPQDPSRSHVNVEIYSTNEDNNELVFLKHSSGIVFSTRNKRTYILTAAHSVEAKLSSCSKVKALVILRDKAPSIEAKIESVRPDGIDLAVVSIERRAGEASLPSVTLGHRTPRRFTRVSVFGSPTGTFRARVSRRIGKSCERGEHCRFCPRQSDCFTLTEQIANGFSGGGVYNSGNQLVGMCIARRGRPGERGQSICISIETLRHYISEFL